MRSGHHGLPCFDCSEEVSEYLKTTGAFRAPYHPDPKLFGWTFTGVPSLRPALPWVQASSTGMASCFLCLKNVSCIATAPLGGLHTICIANFITTITTLTIMSIITAITIVILLSLFLLLLFLWLVLLVLLLSVKLLLFRLLVLLLFLLLLVLSKLQPSTSPEGVRSSSSYSRMTQCQVVDQNLLAVKGIEVWGVGFRV